MRYDFVGVQHGALMVVDSTEQAKERTTGDQKTLRRLAQNGEAARKSRLRKKVQPDQEMTVEEFKAWIYRFDNDHNGQISREELKEALRSLRVWFGWWRARQAMKSSDFNGSGQIDNPKEFEKLVNYAQQRLGMKIHENNDW
ncbi:hypothetical protein ACFXTH_018705 [Malus domestica]